MMRLNFSGLRILAQGRSIALLLCHGDVGGHLQHLSHMERVPVGALGNLFAATETVSDDQPVRGCSTNRREKLELTDSHRQVILIMLETERAGHAAPSRRG